MFSVPTAAVLLQNMKRLTGSEDERVRVGMLTVAEDTTVTG